MTLDDSERAELFSGIKIFCEQLRADHSDSKTLMRGIEDIYRCTKQTLTRNWKQSARQ